MVDGGEDDVRGLEEDLFQLLFSFYYDCSEVLRATFLSGLHLPL